MTRLDGTTLSSLSDRLPVPQYDRTRVVPGVVHIGVGGFHRSHQAMYHDRLIAEHDAFEWGIHGIGLLPQDRRMRDTLAAQDGLYTLVIKHPDGRYEPRVIGSIVGHSYAPDDPEAVIERLASETTKVVTMTLTEGGYDLIGRADVVQDLLPGATPTTAFGFVAIALQRRRERGIEPFAVVSCDNLIDNGEIARTAFSAFARHRDPDLGDWMARHVVFPNSVVDRITPATTDADRAELRERTGIEDGWPVVCEPFVQWVLEDVFADARPPWEAVGALLIDDVRPYEQMKLRLLNATHQGVAYFGRLRDHRLVDEAMRDPLILAFLEGYLREEGAPTVSGVPASQVEAFRNGVTERFANPSIRDTLERLYENASDRIPKFVLPVIRERLAQGAEAPRAAAIVAAWARCLEGVDEHGEPIHITDERGELLGGLARSEQHDPLAFIGYEPVFGDLSQDERFVTAYRSARGSLAQRGVEATLTELA